MASESATTTLIVVSASESATTTLIVVSAVIGIMFAFFLYWKVSQISLGPPSNGDKEQMHRSLTGGGWWTNMEGVSANEGEEIQGRLVHIYDCIRDGAQAFLFAEYRIMAIFLVVFGLLLFVLTSYQEKKWQWSRGAYTLISFLVGGITSIISGYIGMTVAVFSNARTTIAASNSNKEAAWIGAFNTAFRGGGVMGFSLTAIAMVVAYILTLIFRAEFVSDTKTCFECLSGYGLGGSSMAMFGRVGGGIYTKAADVGADLAGKVVEDIPEDDPRNPATIADNVGDNVGDVAGMGSDLFGSYAEGTCAALVVAASSKDLVDGGWACLMFPLVVSAAGILVCIVTSFFATDFFPCRKEEDVEVVLKVQLAVSTVLMTAVLYPLCTTFLPSTFEIGASKGVLCDLPACVKATQANAFFSVAGGLWAGCAIGFITEYFTSHSYAPTREVAHSCKTGAATNIIYGLALGYKSTIIPISLIAIATYTSFTLCGMYGVALAALGMLANLATCLSIDVYGPICDNAGGIAEMSECPAYVREKTDALDAAGNTTAAIGKGFAIGSAALVALALFGAFVTRAKLEAINILQPMVFAWIFVGAMIPYWFTAMTMKSVGAAAMEMVAEVKRQFDTIPGLLANEPGHAPPDHARCIKISTDASLREMVAPGLLVILSPILCGTFFGVQAVGGLLTGSITSGVQLAISQSNTGGAWDNAKKYVERGEVTETLADGQVITHGKGSEVHKASVVGDTVGDPLKDTSGPALNIVMKLQAIISLVFAAFFLSVNCGQGLLHLPQGPTPKGC